MNAPNGSEGNLKEERGGGILSSGEIQEISVLGSSWEENFIFCACRALAAPRRCLGREPERRCVAC